jgi:NDP-sugar pyrophosphorylase family protein
MGRDLGELTAMILAGGLGTRLQPLVADRPKAMADLHGRPFLSHQFDMLLAQGIRSAVICTGHLGEQIEDRFGTSYGPLAITYSRESRPMGTGGALALALPWAGSDPLLVLNGDSLLTVDLKAFFAFQQQEIGCHAMCLVQVEDAGRYGGVLLGQGDQVAAFGEKARTGPGLVNAGIYLLRRSALEGLPLDRPTSLEQDVFPALAGGALRGFRWDGTFLDIGTPESYRSAEAVFHTLKGTPWA